MLKRDILSTLGTRFFVFGVGSIGSILLTRSLGPEGRGFYLGMVSLVALGTQIGTLGLGSSNTYYLSNGREKGSELASNSLVLGLVFGTVLALLAWLAAYRIHGLHEGLGVPAVLAGIATIPASILLLLGQNLLLASGEVTAFNRVDLSRNLGWTALVVIFTVGMGWGPQAAIWLNFFTFVPAAIWVWWRLNRIGLTPRLHWEHAVFRRTLGYGLKAYALTFFGYAVLRIDALLVQDLRGATEGGQYGVAVQLGDLLLTVASTIAMVVFPRAAKAGADSWPTVRRITLMTGGVLAGISVVAYFLAPWGVKLLFGTDFEAAVPAFRILLPGIWFLSIETLIVQYLNAIGMPIIILWAWLATLILNLVLNAFLIPDMGIDGAAWASTFAYAFMSVVIIVIVAFDRRSRAKTEIQ